MCYIIKISFNNSSLPSYLLSGCMQHVLMNKIAQNHDDYCFIICCKVINCFNFCFGLDIDCFNLHVCKSACIEKRLVCDGYTSCQDGSDEKDCDAGKL